MSYHYDRPSREDYTTEEEFQEALKMWEWAEDEYAEGCVERDLIEHN